MPYYHSFLRHHCHIHRLNSILRKPINKRLLSSHEKPSSLRTTSNPTTAKNGAINATTAPHKPTTKGGNHNPNSRLTRLLSRSPKFLKPYISALRTAPVSHITAFLLLHEITAVVPLFTLAGLFHYYNWLPPYFAEGEWVVAGVEKFGRYFKRKGWISEGEELEIERRAGDGGDLRVVEEEEESVKQTRELSGMDGKKGSWRNGGLSVRVVVEFATAYAIVKGLLVPRLLFSAWAAPGFARWTIVPLVGIFRSFRTKSTKPV